MQNHIKSEKRVRQQMVGVRLSKDELTIISTRAKLAGLSNPSYLRKLALEKPVKDFSRESKYLKSLEILKSLLKHEETLKEINKNISLLPDIYKIKEVKKINNLTTKIESSIVLLTDQLKTN